MALQKNRNIRRITVVGAGTTGYLTAFHIAKMYPEKQITWIYPEENQPIGVGEAIIPEVSTFLEKFGVTHNDIIKHCNGTIKLGGYFVGWNDVDHNYSFPFGFEATNPSHNTASLDRIIETNKVPKNILNYSNISTHFRATELLNFLDTKVDQFNNLIIKRETTSLEQLKDTYDLVIDCTGFQRHISFRPDNFLSIKDKIPNDQAFVYRHKYTDVEKQCLPYTVAWAMDYGWIFNIPLKNELACGYVHDSRFDITDEFINYLENKFGIKVNASDFRKVKMITGRNKIHMKDNVVAMGLASNFIEPLESTGLFLVTGSLDKLCNYIDNKITEDEYNCLVNDQFDTLTDFIVAHYKFSKRSNPYWDHYKTVPIEKKPIPIFPNSGWDTILSAFLPEVKRPKEPLDPKELINIHKGIPYHKWIQDETNFT